MELAELKRLFKKPNNFYKYTSFDIGESIISSCCLKFNNPAKFNDPFDCNIDGVIFDLSGNICDYVKKDIEILKTIFNSNHLDNDILQQGFKHSELDKIKNAAITCFSLDGTNDLMWAHYANNHRGMCLEFNNLLDEKPVSKTLGLM